MGKIMFYHANMLPIVINDETHEKQKAKQKSQFSPLMKNKRLLL